MSGGVTICLNDENQNKISLGYSRQQQSHINRQESVPLNVYVHSDK